MPDHPPVESPRPSPEAIREQLRAILVARQFATALNARRFLTYVVEQTLAGQTDSIKELVLGIDGVSSDLRIEILRGSYVPQFQVHVQTPALKEPSTFANQRWYAVGLLVLLVAATGGWWGWRRLRNPPPPIAPSIAVLPFLNLSSDPANEYFTDGLAEELTDALSNAGNLRVASRTSAFFFKGKPTDIHEVASKLHVAFVVEGSVRKQEGHLKVTAQLIRTDDGYHVWSGSFERKLSGVFAVQQELATSVVAALQLKLTGTQSRRLKATHTANKQAFDLYLRGRHALNSFAPDSVDGLSGSCSSP